VAVTVRYMTDPACPVSWSAEPAVRKLVSEFGDELNWRFVMGGLARDYSKGREGRGREGFFGLMAHWLDVADEGGMPMDPRLWREAPIDSTYPACMAVKAAAEQATDGGYAYLRALREGLMCFRRKLDTTEALVEQAREARLDVERFRIDLGSHAIVEAFGADLEEVRTVTDDAREQGQVQKTGSGERLPFPSLVFVGEDGSRHGVYGQASYEDYRGAA
jgi:putative protein-disulfide isomerase